MCSSVVSLYQNQEQDNVNFVDAIQNKPALISFDKDFLQRIISNLIKNAIQAIPDNRQPKINVQCYDNDNHRIIIKVEDNGTGIPEDIQSKIFLPHFSTKTSGMGIGLSMVKKMLDDAQANIWFVTEQNIGTIFFIEFKRNLP